MRFGSFPTLKKRRQFIWTAESPIKVSSPGFFLQYRWTQTPLQVGYTASKKVGNAVSRNRAKRRMRELVRLKIPALGLEKMKEGCLVCVATVSLNRLPWSEVEAAFMEALTRLEGRIVRFGVFAVKPRKKNSLEKHPQRGCNRKEKISR